MFVYAWRLTVICDYPDTSRAVARGQGRPRAPRETRVLLQVFAKQRRRAQLSQFSLRHSPLLPPTFFTTSFLYKYVNFAHYTGQKNHIFCDPKICKNAFPVWAPDLDGGAYDAPPHPLVGWGGNTSPQSSPHSAPSALATRRLWFLDSRTPAQALGPSATLGLDTGLFGKSVCLKLSVRHQKRVICLLRDIK